MKNIASINIDTLRAKSIAELNELGREFFGIELKGNKVERIRTLEELVRKAKNEQAAMEIASEDVTLETLRDELVGNTMPVSRLIINTDTGMVYFNTPSLAAKPEMKPYYKIPVCVNGQSIMDPDYARALIPDCVLTHAPREYKDAVPKDIPEAIVDGPSAD